MTENNEFEESAYAMKEFMKLSENMQDFLDRTKKGFEATMKFLEVGLPNLEDYFKESEHIDEHWVDVDLLPNYIVSNYGRVINKNTGHELKPFPDSNGYLKVGLYHKGIRRTVYLHRLVAKAFFLNYAEGVQVKHKNNILTDNTVLNLTLGVGCRKAE